MIKFFNRQITIIELFFITIIPLGTLFISKVLYIQVQAISIFLACFIIVAKKKNAKIKNNIFLFTSLFLFGLGTIIGLFYVIFGDNDLYKYIQYSFLAFSAYIGLRYGYVKYQNDIINFILFICLSETVLFIPLLLQGEFYRSSIGTSNLFPVMLFLLLHPRFWISSIQKIIGIVIFVLQILCISFSGMRSSVGIAVLTSSMLLIYLLINKKIDRTLSLIKRVLVSLFFFTFIFLLLPSSILQTINDKLNSVNQRFSISIFSDDGVQIDSDDEKGRMRQGQSVLRTIEQKNGGNILLLGYGHGFVFFDEMRNKQTAHSHITWTAFYARYGLLGVLLYVAMFCIVFCKLFFLFLLNRSDNNMLSFTLWLSVLQIFLLSLIAGSLTSIINWVIIGVAVSFSHKFLNN